MKYIEYSPHNEVLNDKLVIRRRDKNGVVISQGKRVGKDCPLSRDEIRAYVELGTVKAIARIRENRDCSLREAITLLNKARNYT